jgi:NADPH:quinone reductase-like Zn-dependent oxidoreductase
MRAVRLTAVNQLEIAEVPAPTPKPGEAVVRLKAAALNHRDVWIKSGQYAGLKFPCIPGSDGAGVVAAVGDGVSAEWIGREVIINACFDWGTDERAQRSDFSILGLPREGTLAGQIAVPVVQLAAKPAHLSWTEAAAVPLTGLTAWRALIGRAQLVPEDRVLITGIGGGAAVWALVFAVAHGAETWVTSSSEEKIARAVKLGARGGVLYSESGWPEKLTQAAGGRFNVVIDSAGGPGFESLIDLTASGGRIAFFGATRGNPPSLPMRKVFWRQISLLGTTMGSPTDWGSMTQYISMRQLRPVISDVFPFDRAAEAFALMERGGQFGKIVLEM